jgi:hypothetical protein
MSEHKKRKEVHWNDPINSISPEEKKLSIQLKRKD